MEVPDPRLVYNGAQRCGAVVSDDEVVPVTEDEVSRQPIEVNAAIRSCAAGRGETMCSEVITSECKRVPATSQQRYSSRHSSQFDNEPLASLSGTVCRRRGCRPKLVHASRASSSIGGQRRLLDNVRAELTDAMTSQQAMFLSSTTGRDVYADPCSNYGFMFQS